MSTNVPPPASLQPSPFLEQLIRFLLPYFTDVCADLEAARGEILETLASYGARTRAELLNAAQVIVHSLASLDMLHEAKTTEMSHSMRLRFHGCANTLSRSSQKHEQMLAKRLACTGPETGGPTANPIEDIDERAVDEAIRDAQAKITSYHNRLSGARPATAAQPQRLSEQERSKRIWGGAMMNVLAEMGMPVEPAPPA
jgi:hypothetical protein